MHTAGLANLRPPPPIPPSPSPFGSFETLMGAGKQAAPSSLQRASVFKTQRVGGPIETPGGGGEEVGGPKKISIKKNKTKQPNFPTFGRTMPQPPGLTLRRSLTPSLVRVPP